MSEFMQKNGHHGEALDPILNSVQHYTDKYGNRRFVNNLPVEFKEIINTHHNLPNWDQVNFSTATLLIQLAPINELLSIYENKPTMFNNMKMVIYGSFNIRTLLQKNKTSIENVINMMNSFKQVLYYETFYATEPNTIESDIGGDISKKYKLVGDLINYWNSTMLDNCEKRIMKTDIDESEFNRTKKIIDSIKSCSTQFVNADTGLIMCMLLPLDDIKHHIFTGNLNFVEKTYYSLIKNLNESNNYQEQFLVIHNGGDNEKKISLYKKHCDYLRQFLY